MLPARLRPSRRHLALLVALPSAAALLGAKGETQRPRADAAERTYAEGGASPDQESAPSQQEPAPELARAERGSELAGPQDVTKVASYRLSARLDELDHRVDGRGTIHWRNTSTKPTHDLYFHLYLNAFRSEDTLFMRSAKSQSRSGQTLGRPGGIEVARLSSPRFGELDIWEEAAPHSPSDPDDATNIRVPLPEPVPAGETLELELEFTALLPEIVERTGFAGSFHLVAQWFPKLARREKDGRWAHFAFHPQAEFYADFGDYDVSLDVPKRYVVGATGQLRESRTEGERRLDRYFAEGVHDFAWTAWDGFEVEERTLGEVEVELLAPKNTAPARAATWRAIEHALPFFNERYGHYPHPTLTVVHPPAMAAAAGGMEYPTFITTGGHPRWPQLGVRLIEQVTVHELAHQWFQGLLASNEHAFPFLDEGLTSYAEWEALRAHFGPASLLGSFGLDVSLEALGRAVTVEYGRDEVIAQPAAEFSSMRSLGAHVYSGTATALTTLARVYGEQRMQAALRDYATRHRFAHPTPEDLLQSVARHVGADAAAALRSMLFERGSVDYEVTEASSVRGDPTGHPRWNNRAIVARRGSLELPVTVRLELTNGQHIDHRWSGRGELLTLDDQHDAALERVVVDPDIAVLIDDNLLNNTRAGVAKTGAPRSSERLWYWAELFLHLLGT